MKLHDIIRRIGSDGWRQVSRSGPRHRQFKHPTKPGCITVAGKPGAEPPTGTVKSIIRQAQIEQE
jgi:predicted RNA binding protein YcfA (HicA-like mRNA interferase family)